MSDDDQFETTSPLASFIVTLSGNQDRVTATGTTTINVYDDDGEIIIIGLIDMIHYNVRTDVVLALQMISYNLQEATNETGRVCVMLMEPAGGLANSLVLLFTISTANVLNPAS